MAITTARKKQLRKKFKVFSAIFKLLVFLLIIVGIPLYIYFFQHNLIDRFSSMEQVNALFKEYRSQGVLFYIGAQIVQIVICIIPGQWLQFAAGYVYGFWLGYFFSLVGAALGSILTYYIAKLLGHDAMHLIFGEEKIRNMLKTMNSKKAVVVVFLIFLIPGIPKDLCNYAAGLSQMKLKPFLIISLIGRTPGMMGSLLIGRQISTGGYTSAAVIAGIAVVLCVLGVVFRKKLMLLLDKFYAKFMTN
ncbi:MAG: TVP38/TMEM64 family protein [Clostridiales bacterium]|nr:TVP38/TMEM64 family protein [Clostridiales bacterium]